MLAKIIFIIAVVAECVLVPLFLKYSWPKKCMKSLCLKTCAAAMFVTTGVCAKFISGNNTEYAKYIIIGLIFGMIGDVFLHLLTENMAILGLGLVAFLVGHIFYIIGFGKAMAHYLPQAQIFDYRAIIAIIMIVTTFFLVYIFMEVKFGIATVPVVCYAAVIGTMVVTCWQLIGRIFLEGLDYGIGGNKVSFAGVVLTIGVGSILFLMSDATLAVLDFGGQKMNRPLKIFNIATYFAGQILIASSIMFLKG